MTRVAIFLCAVLSMAGDVHAQSACGSGEILSAGRKAFAKLKCMSRLEISSDCLINAEDQFDARYAKAQSMGDCPTNTEAGAVEGAVDDFVSNIEGYLEPSMPGANTCLTREFVATGKRTAAKAKCVAKGVARNAPTDTDCLHKAETNFSSAYAKARAIGNCDNNTTADTLETRVNDFIGQLKSTLAPGYP